MSLFVCIRLVFLTKDPFDRSGRGGKKKKLCTLSHSDFREIRFTFCVLLPKSEGCSCNCKPLVLLVCMVSWLSSASIITTDTSHVQEKFDEVEKVPAETNCEIRTLLPRKLLLCSGFSRFPDSTFQVGTLLSFSSKASSITHLLNVNY